MKINKLLILLLFFFNINVKLYSKIYTVTNSSANPNSRGSFPYCLAQVNPGDTINACSSYTITLTKPLELNTDNVTIDFTSEKQVTLKITKNISGSAFTITGTDCTINHLNVTSTFPSATAIAGAGIHISGKNTTLNNCTIKDTIVSYQGGGILVEASGATINKCPITSCTGFYGGGIYLEASGATINKCKITSCSATGFGGGILVNASGTNISNCTITSCSAPGFGGGILVAADNTAITNNNNIYSNTAGSGSNIDVNSNYNSILGNNIYHPLSGDSVVFAPGANNNQEVPTITSATLSHNEDNTVNLTVTGKPASPAGGGTSTLMQFFYNDTANSTNISGQQFITGANYQVNSSDSTYTATFNNVPVPTFNEPIYISATATSNDGTYSYSVYTDLGDTSNFSSTTQATIINDNIG